MLGTPAAVAVAAAAMLMSITLVMHLRTAGSYGHRRTTLLVLLVGTALACVALLRVALALGAPVPVVRADTLLVLTALVLAGYSLHLRSYPRRAGHTTDTDGSRDSLTGAASHRAFQDRLAHECDRAYRFGDSFSLLLLDIDQFRLTNERHGHSTGDGILVGLASRLRGQIREIDLCARFGGDQFGIILPHTFERGGLDAAERLRQSVAAWTHTLPDGDETRVTASAGLACYPEDGGSPSELLVAAERALRFAKVLGGNQVQLHREIPSSRERFANVVSLPGSSHATVVRSLAAAVDVRDRYTHSHSRLVSELAAAIARRMGLKGPEVSEVKVGALLHDVGKIGVPDAVLSKEGPLTPEEWQSIRQHPVLGTAIIEHAPELKPVIPLVLHHQERFDGNGYPMRLAGDEIPVGARIIAAADAYHAIRSDRPYRSGRSHREAMLEIMRCSGSQFDPRVVSALMAVLDADPDLQGLLAPLASRRPPVATADEPFAAARSFGPTPDVATAF